MGRCRIGPISPVGVRRPPIDPVPNDGKAGSRGGGGGACKDSGIDGRCGGSVVIGISCSYVLVKQLQLPIDSLLPERFFFPSLRDGLRGSFGCSFCEQRMDDEDMKAACKA
jgi:hypothetical protein